MEKFELHIDITATNSLALTELKAQCQLSVAQLKLAITKGALWLSRGKHTQRLRRLKKPLLVGDILHFYYNEEVLEQTCDQAILIEDYQDYSIWYKPYGMLSQGSKWSDHLTISRFAQQSLPNERSTFIVHRLDRAATGLIVIAHTKNAARLLTKMFEQHTLEKCYQIIVHGDHRSRSQPDVLIFEIDGKNAKSTFSTVNYNANENLSLLDVIIETGRKHQIRKHAAAIGFPVVGDRLHGDKNKEYNEQLNLQLCSAKLLFNCPITGQLRKITLPDELKPDLEKIAKMLSKDFY